ncbi:hypothetical protein AVEN_68490-1 [Araneus ventricosus]|uniref:RNase H type-1 domain-containing protein n=1 Tax=Araneus ventricosus TaxID=182803 RepID=A0A4Y2I566_ARAVE|nr:hypothetical protein AVEN_68490-1 [Araneus ventricosus]
MYALQKISSSSRRTLCLCSDSKSALESLSNFNHRMHPVSFEILVFLPALEKRGFKILFVWVPSHVGIKGNELADCAVKAASSFLQRELPYGDERKYFTVMFSGFSNSSGIRSSPISCTRSNIYAYTIYFWLVIPVHGLDVNSTPHWPYPFPP